MSASEGNALATVPAAHPGQVVATTSILSDDEITRVWRIAKSLAASGMFKDVTQAEQAFGRILLGRDLGLTPTQALMVIDVVKGNVQIRGKQLLSWVRASDDYDYEVIERTPESGTLRFFSRSKRTGEWAALTPDITFTLEEAKKAGISGNPGWTNWPANMCLWRCASIGVNLHCPDLTGGIPVYTEADSFEDRSIGAGEGDGSEPGWEGTGLSLAQVTLVERVIERADEVGHAGLGSAARGPIQMKLTSQTPGYVEQWLAWAEEELAKVAAKEEAIPEADVVPEPDGQGELDVEPTP